MTSLIVGVIFMASIFQEGITEKMQDKENE